MNGMHDDDLPPDLAELEADFYSYGATPTRPWVSAAVFDGQMAISPRRPELLGDSVDGWWTDLDTWAVWAIGTWRLARWFPPCWPEHPALVEELMALWLHWQACWLPSIDPQAPVGFLRELEWSLGRVERLWKPSCTPDTHRPAPQAVAAAVGTPELHRWWSNPNYIEE